MSQREEYWIPAHPTGGKHNMHEIQLSKGLPLVLSRKITLIRYYLFYNFWLLSFIWISLTLWFKQVIDFTSFGTYMKRER